MYGASSLQVHEDPLPHFKAPAILINLSSMVGDWTDFCPTRDLKWLRVMTSTFRTAGKKKQPTEIPRRVQLYMTRKLGVHLTAIHKFPAVPSVNRAQADYMTQSLKTYQSTWIPDVNHKTILREGYNLLFQRILTQFVTQDNIKSESIIFSCRSNQNHWPWRL